MTDGDALCYHLQVPKVFLMRGAVGFEPDLHETVYPLVTEMLYAVALEFRGPVACRWIQWFLGLVLRGERDGAGAAEPGPPGLVGRRDRRCWSPAVSNGMSAPLNDVALAAFGTAAIFAWTRLLDRPSAAAAAVAGVFAGLAIGVKYPALVLVGLLGRPSMALCRPLADRARSRQPCAGRWLALAAVYSLAAIAVGGCWYLRAYRPHGQSRVSVLPPRVRRGGARRGARPDQAAAGGHAWNLLTALVPLTLQPDRFDSFSHQFGPIFLLFLPAALLERPPRRVLGLAALGYLFLMLCLTQRQSMRFVLIALGPMSVAVAYGWRVLVRAEDARRPRLLVAILLAALGLEAGLAAGPGAARAGGRARARVGRRSSSARREPTYRGRAMGGRTPAGGGPADRPGPSRLLHPAPYTMELAHRRRTGLGRHGESPREIVARLRESGFTHVMLCPPVPETAVEFDPTLGRLLAPWLAGRVADLSRGPDRRRRRRPPLRDLRAVGPSGWHRRLRWRLPRR